MPKTDDAEDPQSSTPAAGTAAARQFNGSKGAAPLIPHMFFRAKAQPR